MIGTVEALGVFLLAILPGFVGLRTYAYGQAPLRTRGALGELGAATMASLAGWIVLYLWRGRDLLPVVLDGKTQRIADRVEAFVELVGLAVVIGLVLGLAARVTMGVVGAFAARKTPESLVADIRKRGLRRAAWARSKQRLAYEVGAVTLPTGAWDRLLTRLNNQRESVVCSVTTSGGQEVLGVLAHAGYADWAADGRDLLLIPELTRGTDGRLREVSGSRGVFVPGSEIALVKLAKYPKDALRS